MICCKYEANKKNKVIIILTLLIVAQSRKPSYLYNWNPYIRKTVFILKCVCVGGRGATFEKSDFLHDRLWISPWIKYT